VTKQEGITIPLHKPALQERLFFLLSGIIVSIPQTAFINGVLYPFVPPDYAVWLSVVVLAPLVEEFSKAFPLLFRHAETERSIFVLGFLVGLGFGIVEFVEYVVLLGAPIVLRVPGIFFHASITSIVAFGIAKKRSLPFYLLAVALHFSNNFLAVLGPIWYLGGPAVIGVAYLLSWYFYSKTQERMIPF
jgi:RsiW-degrading membrane proteinase PrsW (M82 family)